LSEGGKSIQLLNSDVQDWKITFVDTGLTANIGQRLKAIEKYLGDDEMFLANYTDGLTDLPLPKLIDFFLEQDKIASFLSVRPAQSFHLVSMRENGVVKAIRDVYQSGIWINGGFFMFKRDLFKYINPGEELVYAPFQRLIADQQLISYQYDGFWACMDTFKEKQQLDDMYARGEVPWEVWRTYHEQALGA
jgi:glucose-1-phosphate cytidylyltransferase